MKWLNKPFHIKSSNMKHLFAVSVLISLTLISKSQNLQYNDNFSIACHNCYEPRFANAIEEVFPFTKTIEIDIWDTRKWFGIGGWKAMTKDWYVRHIATDKGNINCCGGSFRDCLTRIKVWSDRNPNHEPITIFIDKKENWSEDDETRKPGDLDNLLLSIFQKEKIFTPNDFLSNQKNLKAAASSNSWPLLDSLKGKIIFVITNGTEITSRNPLNEYLSSQQNNATCFVAPKIVSEDEILQPRGFAIENIDRIVFYNLQFANYKLSPKIHSLGCLTRVYGSPETIEIYNQLINEKVNFIAMDNYKLVR